jgi:hypothetical protein
LIFSFTGWLAVPIVLAAVRVQVPVLRDVGVRVMFIVLGAQCLG